METEKLIKMAQANLNHAQLKLNESQQYLDLLKIEIEKSKEKTPFELMVLSKRKIRYKNECTIDE